MSGMMLKRMSGELRLVLFLVVVMGISGCQQVDKPAPEMVNQAIDISEEADLQRSSEVQLVEQMAQYRSQYEKYLVLLQQFYYDQGNYLKSNWAQQEVDHMRMGPRHTYLVVAELAGPSLKATNSIIEADQVYDEGMRLFADGKGALSGLFADKKKLYLAKDKFDALITNYPESDKIDDAAYQIGEIYHHFLKDYHKALLYYQRCWQWDPQTPKAPRYATARIYDDHLHDRIKALEYYQQVLNLETAYPDKIEYAKSRIELITMELSDQ